MNENIVEKVLSYMKAEDMLAMGDTVVAGISGGADSVCLLFLLCRFREKYGLNLHVVHINHGIRQEAGEDASFVEKLCKEWSVPCEIVKYDIPAMSKSQGLTEEEAGRIARYEAFTNKAKSLVGDDKSNSIIKIAVAHNKNDNAETILFHMFRGSGIHGLIGIPSTRMMDNNSAMIIRPLLCLERSEIEKILAENNISWVTDATNLSDEYSRNRIRLNILPEADRVCNNAIKHIVDSSNKLAQIDDLLDVLGNEAFEKCVDEVTKTEGITESISINIDSLCENHDAIISRVLHNCLKEVTGGGKDIGEVQTAQLLYLLREKGNKSLDLARGVLATRSYNKLIICRKEMETDCDSCLVDNISIEEINPLDLPYGIEGLLDEIRKPSEDNKCTKWLDYDKINGQIEIRNRRQKDYFLIQKKDGAFGEKSLKEYMIDSKIPADRRDKLTVVAAGEKCLWLVGYRISDDCRITSDTKRIIKLSLREN